MQNRSCRELFKKKINQKKFKISLNYCISCKHVQIAERLKPDLLFKHYLWETGISKTNILLLKDFLKKLKKLGIGRNSKILEIASNDGSFIQILKNKFNSFVVGVDPAKNLARRANSKKIFTIDKYFNLLAILFFILLISFIIIIKFLWFLIIKTGQQFFF